MVRSPLPTRWGSGMNPADSWRMARNFPDGKWFELILGRRTACVDTRRHNLSHVRSLEERQIIPFVETFVHRKRTKRRPKKAALTRWTGSWVGTLRHLDFILNDGRCWRDLSMEKCYKIFVFQALRASWVGDSLDEASLGSDRTLKKVTATIILECEAFAPVLQQILRCLSFPSSHSFCLLIPFQVVFWNLPTILWFFFHSLVSYPFTFCFPGI